MAVGWWLPVSIFIFRALINQRKAAVEAAARQLRHRGLASPEDCEIKKEKEKKKRKAELLPGFIGSVFQSATLLITDTN